MTNATDRTASRLIRILVPVLVVTLLAGLAPASPVLAATGQWAWMSGASTAGQSGVYGTKGTPAAANVPGARNAQVSWRDGSGNLWLFGGYGYDSTGGLGSLNDLWRYTPSTGRWTWMSGAIVKDQLGVYGTKGTPAAANVPGSRSHAASWRDPSGKLWLFGGRGYDSAGTVGFLNDLWRYDPASGQWTWVSGSNTVNQTGTYGTKGTPAAANVPGARYSAASWVDSNAKLWLFGGQGYDSAGISGYLNDLWRYDPSTNRWTYMSGGDVRNQSGVYGTLGTPAADNIPGGRYVSVSWIDAAGMLWLCGGHGYDSYGSAGYLNDLWRYDRSTGQWAWMSGSNYGNQSGSYGWWRVPNEANAPGGRYEATSWIDSLGKLWLFGGYGRDGAGVMGRLNDLWRYDPTTGLWAWISGSNSVSQPGVYGTKGVPADGNIPGGRYYASGWVDASDRLWLFGGNGLDGGGASGQLNDLWRFEIPPVSNPPSGDAIIPKGSWSLPDVATDFMVSYSDPDGWVDLQSVYFWLVAQDDSTLSIMMRYDVQTDELWVRSPVNESFWRGPLTPGVEGSVQHIYGRLVGLNSSVTPVGTTQLNVTWATVPSWRLSGHTLDLKVRAVDMALLDTGWRDLGDWVVNRMPNWLIPPALQNSTISLTGGSNGFYSFDPGYRDLDKRDDLQDLYFLIADTAPATYAPDRDVPPGVYLRYHQNSDGTVILSVYDYVGGFWRGNVAPRTQKDVQTTNALVRFQWSTVIGYDYVTWKVSWRLQFTSAFVGTHNLYARAIDKHLRAKNGDTGWKYKGTITITP